MFDIGFWELVLISIVSLVILGPQRLPQTVRFVLGWVRRSKQVASELRSKLESELGLEELNQDLNQGRNRVFNSKLNAELSEVQQSVSIPQVRPRASYSPAPKVSAAQAKQENSETLEKKESTL